MHIEELEIPRMNEIGINYMEGPCKTAFVKYRGQLSPKYLKMFKQKEKQRNAIDQRMVYKQQKSEVNFNAEVSGFNWTIPTLWMANRFKATNSSAFGLSIEEEPIEKEKVQKGKRREAFRKLK